MRRFYLQRDTDATGISGTGKVAEGVEFSDGRCALTWLTAVSSLGIYMSIEDVGFIHGHQGQTRVVYEDE